MLKIDTKKNVKFSTMFIIVAVAMYIASRINTDKFLELFAITSLKFTHVFPWRFITYCFYFGESPFFFFFTILVLMVFATKLEAIWGSFYFAIFLIITIVSRSLAAFLFGAEVSAELPFADWMNVYTSLVIAFGFNFAEDKMYLFFFIPIKMKIFAIIALVFLGFSMFNTLLYPLCIQFLQSYSSLMPPEYQTLVDEYYHMQAFYRTGLIPVSPMISPFIVKVCSYLGLIIFAPKIFNFEKVPHFLNPQKEQISNALHSLNKKITILMKDAEEMQKKMPEDNTDDDDDDEDEDDWPDENEIISERQLSEQEKELPQAETPLCDEEDFEPEDDYCKTCGNFQKCAARSNIRIHQVDEIV